MKTALATFLAMTLLASAAAAQDARAEAVALFEESAAAFDAGRYAEAADLLERAYRLMPDPVLLYNLGRAYEGAGDDGAAMDAYRRYLASEGAPDAREVRARLEALASRDEAPESRDAPPATRATDSPSRLIDPLPWIVAGGGGLVALVGCVLVAAGAERAGAASAAEIQLDASNALSEARSLTLAGDVMLVAGLLAAAGGASWGLLDLFVLHPSESDVGVTFGPGSLAIHGSF